MIGAAACLLAGICLAKSLDAQNASASSLADQLKTQYKLAKLSMDSTITEAGTVLVIRAEGILGVPLGNAAICLATYSDGALQASNTEDKARCEKDARKLSIGEKVYAAKIEVDSQKDRVSLVIVGCGSCRATPQLASYKSAIVFQYPRSYLAGAETDQIEDVINQVVSIDSGASEPEPQPLPRQDASTSLTNNDIIKLVQARIADSIIIAKIKSSSCDFDTSTDALIKLKQTGVSDAVQQAMVEASTQSSSSGGQGRPEPAPGPGPDPTPACSDYDACVKMAESLFGSGQWDRALSRFQEASQLDASRGDAWRGIGNADFQMGQYDDAALMWDKAVQQGSTLALSVCHAKALCGDTGSLQLNLKEISFVNKKGEKEFSVAPSEVTSEGAVLFNPNHPAYYLQIRFAGKNYRFYYLPKGVQCSMNFVCPDPGPTQQKVVGNYLHERLARMAAGDFGPQPNKP
jgi:tetratricopeptide (TPR) repeat protein